MKKAKRIVEWEGRYYKVKSDKIEIPDLKALPQFTALIWLNTHTYPRGYSKPSPLAGYAGAVTVN